MGSRPAVPKSARPTPGAAVVARLVIALPVPAAIVLKGLLAAAARRYTAGCVGIDQIYHGKSAVVRSAFPGKAARSARFYQYRNTLQSAVAGFLVVAALVDTAPAAVPAVFPCHRVDSKIAVADHQAVMIIPVTPVVVTAATDSATTPDHGVSH